MKNAYFYIILGTLILMCPVFYNGFPLVYSDTGTYISSGFEFEVPRGRPLLYGVFIRLSSLGISLWHTIFVQCFIVGYLLYRLFEFLFPEGKKSVYLAGVSILSFGTGIGWYCGQLMPDIYSSALLLCFPLLLFGELPFRRKLFVSCLLFFSVAVHFSHFVLSGFVLTLIFLISRIKFIPFDIGKKLRFISCIISIVLVLPFTSLLNFSASETTKINKGSHVFLMGRMLDAGVLESFLNDRCQQEDYVLCGVKDSLPEDSRAFIWNSKTSPLYDYKDWEDAAEPYNEILKGILTSPKHLSLFAHNCVTSSMSQLLHNELGDGFISGWYSEEYSPPRYWIAEYFPHEERSYLQSRQNINLWGRGLDFTFVNRIYAILLLLSVLSLIYASYHGISNSKLKLTITVFLIGIIGNAMITASLANLYDRLQARISWLLVAILLALMYEYWLKYQINKSAPKHTN